MEEQKNFNKHITTLLKEEDLMRLHATVDIKQSNSMVESVFKQLKHSFLLKKNVYNINQLKRHIDFFFEDANQNKPLTVLFGLTPNEVYTGHQPDEIAVSNQTIREVKKRRSLENRTNLCFSCPVGSQQ
jgi:putative transposase